MRAGVEPDGDGAYTDGVQTHAGGPLVALRSVFFNLLWGLWSASMILAVPVNALFFRGDGGHFVRRVSRVWSHGTAWLLSTVCGLRYRVEGREHLPDGPAIIASKHQSAFETVLLSAVLPDLCIVYKKELDSIPLFGWFLRHSPMVSVDRQGGASALRTMLGHARAAVADGRSILIFPEGTRVPIGERGTAHPGLIALVRNLNLPVVPLALNSGLFWPRKSWLRRPGCITLRFLNPLGDVGRFGRDDMAALVDRISSEADSLCRTPGREER